MGSYPSLSFGGDGTLRFSNDSSKYSNKASKEMMSLEASFSFALVGSTQIDGKHNYQLEHFNSLDSKLT